MFNKLKLKIQEKFKSLSDTGKLFYVEIDRDKIWEHYLEGFTDPIEKQGHNCNCCKSFLRQYGGIVTIIDNKVQSIWDIETEELYSGSMKNLKQYIHSLPITDVFINGFDKLGTDKNVDKVKNITWNHFYTVLPKPFINKNIDSIDTIKAGLRDNKSVLKRSLDELNIDSVETVLDLINQNSLYRGKEFEGILTEFLKIQKEYKLIPVQLKDNYCWIKSTEVSQAMSRIRNTSIGTLLINLSENVDLDTAVGKFEAVVAPTNYKRPTALVTPKMVEEAKTKLSDLGLLTALERRFATSTDLDIKDILYIDKTSNLTDVFEDIKKDSEVNPKSFSKIEEVGIEDFITKILPTTKSLSVLLENSHINNFTTLLTSVDKESSLLFKWNNPFSWSYTGGITDSIKEKVKAAGGKVDGELRVSLSWYNYDDLDLHVVEPNNNKIYYSNKRSLTSGQLDVDMNAGSGTTRNAVENIIWTNKNTMFEGKYQVIVHNFNKRETTTTGFIVEIECNGEIFNYEFKSNPINGQYQTIIEFDYSKTKGITIKGDSKSILLTKEKWGLKTNRFHKVKNIMLSPNYWNENKIGNKHYLFLLEHCISDETTRPFFNEFLKEDLNPHRKFLEILSSKLQLNPPNNQLSGIGFSDTQRSNMIVQIEGSFKRNIKIIF